ncbi:MAG: glycerophosphodiester phosphodiesterase [Chloroflexota bacterium]
MAVQTLRLAHRGDWRREPENSLAAFDAALTIPGCDGVEFDVRLAADGVPVVYHDETLVRVHGRVERIDAMRSDGLVDLGIPTLEDVLRSAGRHPFLDVEFKVDAGPAGIEVLAAGRGPELHNAVISSFDRRALEGVMHRAPTWSRWLNATELDGSTVAAALALGCRGVSVEWHALDTASIARGRAAGLEIAAWTVHRRPTYDRLARLGLVAVCVEGAALDG